MFRVVQVEVGGFDLFGGYPRFDLVKLVQERGDLPCLGADVDVVEAEAEEDVAGEILARFVD